MPKVSVYIRNHQTREYEPADPKTAYPQGTIFCLRYKKDGKRKWETLNDTFVTGHRMSYSLARSIAKMREGELELRKPTAHKPEAVIRVWETDVRRNPDRVVLQILRQLLHQSETRRRSRPVNREIRG